MWSPPLLPRAVPAVAAVLALVPVAAAQVLNPKTYASPSGRYELSVDPRQPDGGAPATYRMTLDGEVVWERSRRFSLWGAQVTNGGRVAGYAYRGGVWDRYHGRAYNGLHVVAIGPDGRVLARDPASRHEDTRPEITDLQGDSPIVRHLWIDPDGDRFVAWVHYGWGPTGVWWTYRLSTGEWLGDVVPEGPDHAQDDFVHSVRADLLPSTPLTLVQWFVDRWRAGESSSSAALSLLAPDGREVWRFDLPGEYDGLEESAVWRLEEAEQVELRPRGFSFRSLGLGARLSFDFEPDPSAESGWRLARSDRVAPPPTLLDEPNEPPATEPIELEPLGAIELRSPGAHRSPIARIGAFGIDPVGTLGFVRWGDEPRSIRFVRVSPGGAILTDAVLELSAESGRDSLFVAPLSADRWLLMRSELGDDVDAVAWWIDADTGVATRIPGFACRGRVDSVTATGDGGFFAVVARTTGGELTRYGAGGERLWHRRVQQDDGTSFSSATWVEGLGPVGLADDALELFDEDGRHVRSVDLAAALGGEPLHFADLRADRDGGVFFERDGALLRIDLDDGTATSLQLAYPDAQRLARTARVAPDGSLWATDGHVLVHLGEDGFGVGVLGPRPEDDDLDQVDSMRVDEAGRLYAFNARTEAVHVFDARGEPLGVSRSPREELEGAWNPGGELWIGEGGAGGRWSVSDELVRRLDRDGAVLRRVRKRPDGSWLEQTMDAAVAPDGTLAVVAGAGGLGFTSPAVVCVYDPSGEPLRTIPLTEERFWARIALHGSTLITTDGGAVRLYDLAGGAPRRFAIPELDASVWWEPLVTPDGAELRLHVAGSTRVLRYALPQ